jgi:hypothetical protein
MKTFVEANLNGGEIVIAAAHNETRARNCGISGSEEVNNLIGWKR